MDARLVGGWKQRIVCRGKTVGKPRVAHPFAVRCQRNWVLSAEVERRVAALLSSLRKGLAAAHAELDSCPVTVAVAQSYRSGND